MNPSTTSTSIALGVPRIVRPQDLLNGELGLVEVNGSIAECGRTYGRLYANLIYAFLSQETKPNASRIELAQKCLPFIKQYTPTSFKFLEGMQQGSGLSLEELTILSLHEEIYHEKKGEADGHCTAFLVSSRNSPENKSLVAQNWDWSPAHFPWASLLKIQSTESAHTLTLNYPGLWSGCGINSEGLAHMWTGSGYFPTVLAEPGVPSYLLISELLTKSSVPEAVAFLKSTPNAGAFIFLLADKDGNTAVVEALPGGNIAVDLNPLNCRSNQYDLPEMVAASTQEIDPLHSIALRKAQAIKFLADNNKGPTLQAIKDTLGEPPIYRQERYERSTEDSLIADCSKRTLWTRRGGLIPGSWIETGF
jgi:predicted choloylglycine hydrolase